MAEQSESIIVKAGTNTFFFDVRGTEKGNPYLVITQTRFKTGGVGRDRVRMAIFPQHIPPFQHALQEAVLKLNGANGNENREGKYPLFPKTNGSPRSGGSKNYQKNQGARYGTYNQRREDREENDDWGK